MVDKTSNIYIAGHTGLVGSSIVRIFEENGFKNLYKTTSSELDLRDSIAVKNWFESNKIDYVIDAAAKVGGILANHKFPAEFIFDNLMIQSNLIHYSYLNNVKKFIFLGSSCIYPKMSPQPIVEDYLLTGKLEETNQAYAVAKIAGITMCQSYRKQYGFNAISLMPTNLYGPNDNFDLENSHVLPALLRKFHEAKNSSMKSVTVWGTGKPRREFLYVDDLAEATIFLLDKYNDPNIINIGCGKDISISELAHIIKKIVGFKGKIVYDTSKPDGTPKKLLDISKLSKLGWKPKFSFEEGIERTYSWYLSQIP